MILDPRKLERSTQVGGRVTPIWWSRSVRCTAPAGTSSAPSKAMLVAYGDFLRANGNGRLIVSATLRIVRPPRDGFITLLDVEDTDCWDGRFGPNPSPGVRLLLDADGALAIDRRKIGEFALDLLRLPSLTDAPSRLAFEWRIEPRRSLFGLDTYAGVVCLTEPGTMVPTVDSIRAATGLTDFAFAREPVYNRIQIGVTANASSSPVKVIVEKLAVESHE